MGRKLAKHLSNKRTFELYYNGGSSESEDYERYRFSISLATNAERIQLQAYNVEAGIKAAEIMAEDGKGGEGEEKTQARIERGVGIMRQQYEYLSQGQLPPDELYSRQLIANHVHDIQIVSGADDGLTVDEAVYLVGGEEKSWKELDSGQRLDLVHLHISLFAKLIPEIVPNAPKAVLGKSDMQRVTEKAAAGLRDAPTSLTKS